MYTRAIKVIKRYCDFLHLKENVIRQVEEMYHQIQERPEMKGKKLDLVIAGCIFLVCNRNLIEVHMSDLEPMVNVPPQRIAHFSHLINKLVPTQRVHSYEHIKSFCIRLGIPKEHKDVMAKMCKYIEDHDFFEAKMPKPKTIAAAVMSYYLKRLDPKYKRSLSDIKGATGIKADQTIKQYVQSIEEKEAVLEKLFGSDLRSLSTETTEKREPEVPALPQPPINQNNDSTGS